MIENTKFIATSGLLVVCIILMMFQKCEKDNLKEENNLLKATNSMLQKKVNRDGTQTAQIELLQGSNTDLLLKLDTKDETIKQLQKAVKAAEKKGQLHDGGSVTVFTTTTTKVDSSSTVLEPGRDSTCPTYHGLAPDSTWVNWATTSDCKTTRIKLKVTNAYSVIIGSERTGFLKKRKSIVEVNNSNPFTDVQSLRAFEVKDNRNHRVTIGAQAGFGFTLKGMGPYVGVGLNLKLLEL